MLTANEFITRLKEEKSNDKIAMSKIFSLAKEFIQMPIKETEKLLNHSEYEVRLGAVSIMDFQARNKKITPEFRKELFELYIRKHDKINTWDMVDRSAPYVVGGYLNDKPRDILYKIARSKNLYERRTAIVSTYYFIRSGDTSDTFKIAEILAHDPEEHVQKAVGSWVREAGKKDPEQLIKFLNKHAATLPRVTLRYAIEKLPQQQRIHYLKLHKTQ